MIRRDAGEYPRAALLIHDFAGSINGVHDDAPSCRCCIRTARKDPFAALESLSDQYKRPPLSQFFKECQQRFFADGVDSINRVAFLVSGNVRELFDASTFGCGNDSVTNAIV